MTRNEILPPFMNQTVSLDVAEWGCRGTHKTWFVTLLNRRRALKIGDKKYLSSHLVDAAVHSGVWMEIFLEKFWNPKNVQIVFLDSHLEDSLRMVYLSGSNSNKLSLNWHQSLNVHLRCFFARFVSQLMRISATWGWKPVCSSDVANVWLIWAFLLLHPVIWQFLVIVVILSE